MTLSNEKVDLAMARLTLDKKALAAKAGMSRSRLNVLLNSKVVTPVAVGRLANALECDPLDIIED